MKQIPLIDITDCFEYQIEYSGQHLGNPINNFNGEATDCQQLCESTNGCNYFVWRNKECALKREQGNKNGNSAAISGPAKCT